LTLIIKTITDDYVVPSFGSLEYSGPADIVNLQDGLEEEVGYLLHTWDWLERNKWVMYTNCDYPEMLRQLPEHMERIRRALEAGYEDHTGERQQSQISKSRQSPNAIPGREYVSVADAISASRLFAFGGIFSCAGISIATAKSAIRSFS